MRDIDCTAIAQGFWELFKQHPELMVEPLTLSAMHEVEAVALLLAISENRWEVWADANELAKATARALLMDFFAKIAFPKPGEFQNRHWHVEFDTPANQALAVIAQELKRSHPEQSNPH